jgi:hypothetical protein
VNFFLGLLPHFTGAKVELLPLRGICITRWLSAKGGGVKSTSNKSNVNCGQGQRKFAVVFVCGETDPLTPPEICTDGSRSLVMTSVAVCCTRIQRNPWSECIRDFVASSREVFET